MNQNHNEIPLVTPLWKQNQHLNFGEICQVARTAASAASDKAHELTKAKFVALGRKPKIDFDNVRLQAITCGIMDQRAGQCMYGTHHAVVNGRTLCGQSATPREKLTTMWFDLESISQNAAREFITCNRCRVAMGFDKVRESRILL